MKNGKYQNKKSGFNVRPLVLMLAVALLIGATIGGTIAWLTASTNEVENTFTVGDINIELEENGDKATTTKVEKDFKMVPGNTIDKKPLVTVKANSEKSWLFVKVTESSNLSDFITYVVGGEDVTDVSNTNEIEGGWKEYTPTSAATAGVKYYYREVAASTTDTVFSIIGNKGFENKGSFVADKVLVKTGVTKAMMDAFDKDNDGSLSDAEKEALPTLTFEAAAIQYDNLTTVAAAWDELPAAFKPAASGSTN